MSHALHKRIEACRRRLSAGRETLYVVLGGAAHERWRAPVAKARARGDRVRLIRFVVAQIAESEAEAAGLCEAHRRNAEHVPLVVRRRGFEGEVLASWDPGLPGWLGPERTP